MRYSMYLGFLLMTGCGPSFGSVSGKVTYKGQPVTAGTVVIYDSQNNAPSAEIGADGTYEIPKVAVGPTLIAVIAPTSIVFKGMNDAPGAALPSGKSKPPPFPAKYADREKSGFTLVVKGGSNAKDLPLE